MNTNKDYARKRLCVSCFGHELSISASYGLELLRIRCNSVIVLTGVLGACVRSARCLKNQRLTDQAGKNPHPAFHLKIGAIPEAIRDSAANDPTCQSQPE